MASETIIIGTLQAVAAVALAIGAILLKIIRDDQKELRDTLAGHVKDSQRGDRDGGPARRTAEPATEDEAVDAPGIEVRVHSVSRTVLTGADVH